MKILIAYDGSPCADAAIRGLQRAGLPSEADVMILTMADVFPPPAPESLKLTEKGKAMLDEAAANAESCAAVVRSSFPHWSVRSEASPESPVWGILKEASEWQADLIVVGSHGKSAGERVFLGSVSQRVMTHAHCSVRVCREASGVQGPPRLLIGFDGSEDSELAVRRVAERSWVAGTAVRVVTALDHQTSNTVEKNAEAAAEKLRAAGLSATNFVIEGQPRHVLLEVAGKWGADCIFLGATGVRGLRRLLIGSVASSVTAHARCSVEIVR
jgi:nucleotide-binding universal stress UspA family protein